MSYVFLQINSTEILSGSTNYMLSPQPSGERPSFYAPDFFLTDSNPWIVPESISTVKFSDMPERYTESNSTSIIWSSPDEHVFKDSFDTAKRLINDKTLKKIVPVSFESGRLGSQAEEQDFGEFFLKMIPKCPTNNLFLYGLSLSDAGIIGLSPEILFEIKNNTLFTSALAGTAPLFSKYSLLDNYKDLDEHKLVIDDITEKLERLGTVSIEATDVHEVGTIAHLKTPIQVSLNKKCTFEDAVAALHPTAALGAFPLNTSAWDFLQNQDKIFPRDRFGAPFGIRYPSGEGFCLVAIRGIQWKQSRCSIGAGAGIVEKSEYLQELQEIQLKRNSVKGIFRI